jgi:DNA-binding transcriptional ArsR family regulator
MSRCGYTTGRRRRMRRPRVAEGCFVGRSFLLSPYLLDPDRAPGLSSRSRLDIILVITKIISVLTETSVLTAIASPRRREILRLVWDHEVSAGDISRAMPDVTFGAVSLHLRALTEAGLLDARSEHRHRFYRARPEAFGPLRESLEHMWNDALWKLKLAAELEQTRRGPRPRRTAKDVKRRRSR